MKKVTFPHVIRAGSVAVKVYRLKRGDGREVFTLAWHVGGVRQTQQFKSFADAKEEGSVKAEQLAAGRIEAAAFTKAERDEYLAIIDIAAGESPVAAMREWRQARDLTGPDLLRACEAWADRHGGRRKKEITVNQAIAKYLTARAADGIDIKSGPCRTFTVTRGDAVKQSFASVFGEMQLAAVTVDQLAAWLGAIPDPVSRNTKRKHVVALWRWCRRRGFLPLDVMTAAERTDQAKLPSRKIELVSVDGLRRAFAIIAESQERHKYLAPLALAAHCGMRRAEVHGQLWDDIDLQRGILKVTAAKPNTPAYRTVPLSEAAIAWLTPRRPRDGKGPVCDDMGIDKVRKLCRNAELDLADNGFRHSWISARVEVTSNIPLVALEGGTSVRVINRHYRELMHREDAEAWLAAGPVV